MKSTEHSNANGHSIEIITQAAAKPDVHYLSIQDGPYYELDNRTAYWLLLHLSILFPGEYEHLLRSDDQIPAAIDE